MWELFSSTSTSECYGYVKNKFIKGFVSQDKHLYKKNILQMVYLI